MDTVTQPVLPSPAATVATAAEWIIDAVFPALDALALLPATEPARQALVAVMLRVYGQGFRDGGTLIQEAVKEHLRGR